MQIARDILTLFVLFLSLYFEVFMLITYFERKQSLRRPALSDALDPATLPGVTIIVPCFNEEKTVAKTIDSLLDVDYPKDKLAILAVNDGSTDGTALALEAYRGNPQISIVSKENGGKHTALNLGIKMATTEFVGCLDADSYAEKDALLRIVRRFDDAGVMAVVPALHVHKSRTVIQRLQKVEYVLGVFLRSVLAELNALYVTPGPFSIFRKSIFDRIGYYRKAHNTEDMEMALRMQSHGMKIASAHDAIVYTSSPPTVKKLYRQRVRWTSGFLNNVRDYRYMLLNQKYGHVGGFVLPMMLVSAVSVSLIVALVIYDLAVMAHAWYVHVNALGLKAFEFTWPSFSWFYTRSTPIVLLGYVAIAVILGMIFLGTRLSRGTKPKLADLACYGALYSLIAPFWILRSLANVALHKQAVWR